MIPPGTTRSPASRPGFVVRSCRQVRRPAGGPGAGVGPLLVVLGRVDQDRLCCREARHGDAERRAGDVVEADRLALVDRGGIAAVLAADACLLYTSPSPRDRTRSRMPSSA